MVDDTLPTAASPPPKSAIDDLIPGGLPAEGLDPLAEGILMPHQAAWIQDKSPLKIAEKGRRTGVTFAEALDSTLNAAASKSAGGDHTWYIGDTKDKGLEFVAVCARFAQHVAKELLEVEEFLFDDTQPDGSSRTINAYRIRFASGFQVAALSSNPANIRGLQGRVVIDEAAFHRDVAAVIDACNAMLIWGGVIRIISTHNGALSPFAELIKETREGKYDYSIHRISFDDAVAGGIYERVCLIRGWEPSADAKADWYQRIRRAYGTRVEAMREELDVIPREGEGVMLPLALIEACSTADYVVKRWEPPADGFVDWAEAHRRADMLEWLERELAPHLEALAALPFQCALGGDFAMRQDRSVNAIGYTGQDLVRHIPLIVELRQCPYDQQRQALFYIGDKLGGFASAILDANGNGMALAQEARQKFGADCVNELSANDPWYREHSPKLTSAFQDRGILIPADLDVRTDLRQFKMIGGVGKIPRAVRTEGTDGGKRHGDAGVAILNFYAATLAEVPVYDYRPAPRSHALDERGGDIFDRGRSAGDGARFIGKGGW